MELDIQKITDGLGAKASQKGKDAAIEAINILAQENARLKAQRNEISSNAEKMEMAIKGYQITLEQATAVAQNAAAQTGGLSQEVQQLRADVAFLNTRIEDLQTENAALKEPDNPKINDTPKD